MFRLTIEAETYEGLKEKIKDLNALEDAVTVQMNDITVDRMKELLAPIQEEAFKLPPVTAYKEPMDSTASLVAEPVDQPPIIVPSLSRTERTTAVDTSQADTNGFMWDERIHSSSKQMTTKGTWRYRRNLEPEYIKQIEAELRGTAPQVGRSTIVEQVVTPLQTTPVAIPATPAIPVSTPMAPVFSNKYAHTFDSFHKNLVTVLANLINDGKITREYVTVLNGYFKVGELYEIFTNQEQVKELYDNFCDAKLIERVQ